MGMRSTGRQPLGSANYGLSANQNKGFVADGCVVRCFSFNRKTKQFGEEGQLPLFKQELKCWLTDRSWQGNGRKDRQLPSEPSRWTRVPQSRSQDPERFCRGPGDGQGRATGSGTSSGLRTRETRPAQPHWGFVRPTSANLPSQGTLPRDGCLLTPKISGYPKHKPLGQDRLWQLRDHPWG